MLRSADFIDQRQLALDGVRDAALGHHIVQRAGKAAFGARSVVSGDVKDQRVVGVGERGDGVEQASDVIVRMRQKAGEDLHMPRIKPLRVRREFVPGLDLLWARRQDRIRGNNAELLLTRDASLPAPCPSPGRTGP